MHFSLLNIYLKLIYLFLPERVLPVFFAEVNIFNHLPSQLHTI